MPARGGIDEHRLDLAISFPPGKRPAADLDIATSRRKERDVRGAKRVNRQEMAVIGAVEALHQRVALPQKRGGLRIAWIITIDEYHAMSAASIAAWSRPAAPITTRRVSRLPSAKGWSK